MTDLVIAAADVAVIRPDDLETYPDGEGLTVGEFARLNSSGEMVKGNGTAAGELGDRRGIVVEKLAQAVRVLHKGLVDLGDALDALAFDDPIYISDTDATFSDDAADSTVDQVVGRCVPGHAHTTADKLAFFDFNAAAMTGGA